MSAQQFVDPARALKIPSAMLVFINFLLFVRKKHTMFGSTILYERSQSEEVVYKKVTPQVSLRECRGQILNYL